MQELKTVVILDGKIINVGEMEDMPDGATVEQREMVFTDDFGWREVDWFPEPTESERLKADLEYLAIMTGVEL